jgi:hypothetical protein
VTRRERWLRERAARYGMTVEQYRELEASSRGRCYICGAAARGRSLSVDHCHDTGRVRGLLCHHCNTAIGLFREDPAFIAESLVYLVGVSESFDVLIDAARRRDITFREAVVAP